MKFYDQFTTYQMMKKFQPDIYRKMDYNKFYAGEMAGDIQWAKVEEKGLLDPSNLMMEKDWYHAGMPYYKIWPGVFDQFISTRLDIKTDYLKSPHNAFAILFPVLDEPLLTFKIDNDDINVVKSIIVQSFTQAEIKESYPHLVSPLDKIFPDSKYLNTQRGIIKVRIDFVSKDPTKSKYFQTGSPELDKIVQRINTPSVLFRNIEVIPNISIDDAIGEFIDVSIDEFESVPASVVEACFRLVVGVLFVSTGSQKVLEYDVITKHLNAYRQMREQNNLSKCKEYEFRARKKGKIGWNIGAERYGRHLILPKGMTYDEAFRDKGSHQLLYQHIRGGHWHLYHVGAGKKQHIVKWVEDTVVRKDLPIRPIKKA
jgi:hypothetical protein